MSTADLRRLLPEFRTKVIADLIGIASFAALALLLIGFVRVEGVDLRTAHLGLTLATVAFSGAVAVVVGTQAMGHPRRAYLSVSFGLYAVLDVAVTALGPRTLYESPELMGVLAAGSFAAAVLLALWAAPKAPAVRGAPWGLAAVVVVTALGAAAWRTSAVSNLLSDPTVQAAIAFVWVLAAVRALTTGLGRSDLPVTRVGLGLALLAASEIYRVWIGVSPANPDLLLSGLQVVGTLAVLGGVVGRSRGDVMSLHVEGERQRAALRDAAEHAEGVEAVAAERDHELANGLAGLNGIAYLLEQLAITPEGSELRSAVVAEIARLHAMLAGSGQHGEEDPFDVAQVLSEMVVLRRASGMSVDMEAPNGLVVAGGRAAFAQAATNLLANCARHAPGSPVLLRAFPRGDRVVVEVRDDGPGVPPGREEEVLERGTTAAPTGGSGLGLHVSARLLRERDGNLRVLPRQPQERGFAVRLELPRAGDVERDARATRLEQAAG